MKLFKSRLGNPNYVLVMCVFSCSVVSNSLWPQMVAHQAPLSVGILQARMLEWVAMPSSRGSFHPGIKHRSPALQAESLPAELPEKPCFTHRTTYTVVKCIFVPQIVERSVQRDILKASSGSIFKALKVCEACRYFVGFLFFFDFFFVWNLWVFIGHVLMSGIRQF